MNDSISGEKGRYFKGGSPSNSTRFKHHRHRHLTYNFFIPNYTDRHYRASFKGTTIQALLTLRNEICLSRKLNVYLQELRIHQKDIILSSLIVPFDQ